MSRACYGYSQSILSSQHIWRNNRLRSSTGVGPSQHKAGGGGGGRISPQEADSRGVDDSTPAALVGGDNDGGSSGASTNAGEEAYVSEQQGGDGGSSGGDGTADGSERGDQGAGGAGNIQNNAHRQERTDNDHVAAAVHLDISKAAALLKPVGGHQAASHHQHHGGGQPRDGNGNGLSSGSSLPEQTRQGILSGGDSGDGGSDPPRDSHRSDKLPLKSPSSAPHGSSLFPGEESAKPKSPHQSLTAKRPAGPLLREGIPQTREVPLGLQELVKQGDSRSNTQLKTQHQHVQAKQEGLEPVRQGRSQDPDDAVHDEEDREAEAAAAVLGSLREAAAGSGHSAFTSMTVFLPRQAGTSRAGAVGKDKAGSSPSATMMRSAGKTCQEEQGSIQVHGLLIPPLPQMDGATQMPLPPQQQLNITSLTSSMPQQQPLPSSSPVMLPDSIVRLISALSSAKPSALAAAGASLHPTSVASSGATAGVSAGHGLAVTSSSLLGSGSLGFGMVFDGSDSDSKASKRQAAVAK